MHSSENANEPDHGEVVRAPHIHRIWAWIFPALAAFAGLWLLWSNWKDSGPEIEIRFAEAPGIQAGKTSVIYRGVVSGRVTGVRLDPKLGGVIVKARLKAFASHLASEETEFWIDQPVISIRETTGLDAIIQGNSIQARYGGGRPAEKFDGLPQPPLDPLLTPSLVIRLYASEIPFLGRGTPVYHRGVAVGAVKAKKVDENGRPFLQVAIDEAHKGSVLTSSRFWILPATSLKLSARGASLDVAGLDALIEGGIAFENFSPDGKPVESDSEFRLGTHELDARMDGPEIALTFEDARGLLAGETLINCLGYPVGILKTVALDPAKGVVTATARLDSRFAYLATSGARLTLVRARVSLDGVSGLDTLVTGAYIALDPGSGEPAKEFAVRSISHQEWQRAQSEREGVNVVLHAAELPAIEAGAPVLYRGLPAGRVIEKFLNESGEPSLRVVVTRDFRDRLTARARFWHVPPASVSAGPGTIDVELDSVMSLLRGSIAFDDFSGDKSPAETVASGTAFELFATESSARAVSPPVRIFLDNGQGLLAGKTQMRRMGVPVGIVDSVRPVDGRIEVTARFEAEHEGFRRQGAEFAIVQPKLSLDGLSGIETLISGVYIECVPGSGPLAGSFTARSAANPDLIEAENRGFVIKLTTDRTIINPGAPITYRDITVGKVVEKTLSSDGTKVVLTASIAQKHRDLIRENTVFWDAGDIQAQVGFFKVKVDTPSIVAPDGKIALFTPGPSGAPAREGSVFPLSQKAPRQR